MVWLLLQINAAFQRGFEQRYSAQWMILSCIIFAKNKNFWLNPEFAVEKFIDTEERYCSFGMILRLAFAVAAHLEPQIPRIKHCNDHDSVAFQIVDSPDGDSVRVVFIGNARRGQPVSGLVYPV